MQTVPIKKALGQLPEAWDKSVIFFANILSLFFGNESQTDVLKAEVGVLETYGSRLIPLMNLLFNGSQNLLVLEYEPERSLIEYFQNDLGLGLPDIKVISHSSFMALQEKNGAEDLQVLELFNDLKSCKAPWVDAYVTDSGFEQLARQINKKTISSFQGSHQGNNKLLLYEFLKEKSFPVFDTFIANSVDEIKGCLEGLKQKGYVSAVIKSQVGASGIGMMKVSLETSLDQVSAYLFYEGPCLVQGWLDETFCDIKYVGSPSVQMFIKDDQISLYDITEQILSVDSVHEGNVAPPPYFAGDDKLKEEVLCQAEEGAQWLYHKGYRGTASADFHVIERDNLITVYMCEINARVTGATYPSILARHCDAHCIWLMRNIKVSPSVKGAVILSALKERNLLYYPKSSQGILPINFNLNAKGDIVKGQFLFMGKTLKDVYALLDEMSQLDAIQGGFDRD